MVNKLLGEKVAVRRWHERRRPCQPLGYAAMIPQFIRDVASFLAAGVLCVLPLAEQRELPCFLCDNPIVTAAYADRFPIIAVVESWVEFHLIKGSSRKRRNDSDAVRPAWELLALQF